MTIEEIKAKAAAIAEEMRGAKSPVPPDLRKRFIDVRTALFERGIYDPVLVRFDSATVPQASPGEIADELSKVAMSL